MDTSYSTHALSPKGNEGDMLHHPREYPYHLTMFVDHCDPPEIAAGTWDKGIGSDALCSQVHPARMQQQDQSEDGTSPHR